MGDIGKIAIPNVSLPKGGGAVTGIGETFQPNAFTGTASLSIPIPTSPCRGFEPQLSLDYSSGSGNGIFGIGFSLAIPNISRKTEKGFPKYDDTDTFLISNADDLVPKLVKKNGEWVREERFDKENNYSITQYRPRTEGLFARIEQWVRKKDHGTHWRVTTKDNVTSIYGEHEDARVADPTDPTDKTRIFQWLLEETHDAKGNRIRYEYKPEDSQVLVEGSQKANSSLTANKHIHKIKYGNHPAGKTDGWHFELIFDYGERTPDKPDQLTYEPKPNKNWKLREDPFSSYRAGFEIRTQRLCRGILLFHRFGDDEPFLVRGTHLEYKETPFLSLLNRVTQVGYRKENGAIQSKAMPPLVLEYSEPKHGPGFERLTRGSANGKNGELHQRIDELVDLYGDGLPGILHSDDQTTLYSRPRGKGHYDAPQEPAHFPIDRDLEGGQYALLDLGGDGKLDLVAQTPSGSGYFQSNPVEETWDSYRAFPAYPTDVFSEGRQMVDVTGDGLADLVMFESEAVRVYPSQGKRGFAPATVRRRRDDLPLTRQGSAVEHVGFADMIGDGGNHLVRIRSGSVECWPHLGYGRFGEKVILENAPHFPGQLDPARLFLTDIDGSGTTDLVYACHDHLEIYRNQSGNGFADAEVLPLPQGYDNLDNIRFADVLGNGTACLILTSRETNLTLRHTYYDFNAAGKPHLLTGVNNNMGAEKKIHYDVSTKYWLDDMKVDKPWVTRLSFPVQVIKSVEVIDHIAGSRLVTRYAYHDGYYDPEEREFRGFGYVEQWDTESFDKHKKWIADRKKKGTSDGTVGVDQDPTSYVAPVYTRSWYHTGASVNMAQLSNHYQGHYYTGDPLAHHLPDTVLDRQFLFSVALPEGFSGELTPDDLDEMWLQAFRSSGVALGLDSATVRVTKPGIEWLITSQGWEWTYRVRRGDDTLDVFDDGWQAQPAEAIGEAYRALHGHKLREEIYAWDEDNKEDHAGHPYAVTESNFKIRLVQPMAGQKHAVCFVHPSEEVSWHYERNPKDPRVEHSFTVSVDDYGHVLKSCHVFYPRRNVEGVHPEQQKLKALATIDDFINVPGKDSTRDFYLLGVPSEEKTFELGGMQSDGHSLFKASKIAAHLEQALKKKILRFKEPLKVDAPQARLLSWERHIYWDQALTKPLEFGEVAAQELYHHSEVAVFSPDQLKSVFGKKLNDDVHLKRNPENGNQLGGGYDLKYDYWWNPGLTQHYHGADHYYLPTKTVDPFGAENIVTYDDYQLVPVTATDALGNVTQAEIDYHTLQPARIIDINDNTSEVLFDPLEMVIATSIYGTENGQPKGDAPLAPFVVCVGARGDDVVKFAHDYLQQATTYFFYDLFSWAERKQPSHIISLLRETHVNDLTKTVQGKTEPTKIQIHIAYSDGFGRALQTKIKAGPGMAFLRNAEDHLRRNAEGKLVEGLADPRWLTSGRTVYNNKGKPVKQYEPFYSSTPNYEPERELTEYGVTHITHYDPLLRVVQVTNPDGFFSRVEFTPWEEKHYDENDTNEDSPFFNTPERHVLDTQGRTFQIIQQLENDQELVTRHELDIQGNELFSTDPRGILCFKHKYDMTGAVLWTKSVDAGERWALHNAMGSPIHVWDSRKFHITTGYDKLHRPTQMHVKGNDGNGLALDHVVEKMVYGDDKELYPDPASVRSAQEKNLRGKLVLHYDQAGVVDFDGYDIKGALLMSTRRLRKDYQLEANWGKEKSLEDDPFVTEWTHDALGRVTREIHPDGSISNPKYHPEGRLRRLDVAHTSSSEKPVPFVEEISYNPKGQRTAIRYGNGVESTFEYDPETFRLKKLRTARTRAENRGCLFALVPSQLLRRIAGKSRSASTLQDIDYTYDPVGNVTHIRDASHKTVFTKQQNVEARCNYTYDALYRLTAAKGREHPALAGSEHLMTNKAAFKQSRFLHLNDSQQLRNYSEDYTYDPGGNLTHIKHQASQSPGSWTRDLTVSDTSNRAVSKDLASTPATVDTFFDDHGNLKKLENVRKLRWNYRDNIASATVIERDKGSDDVEYYVYDSAGQRVRKVTETLKAGGVEIAETIYLGGVEIKHVRQNEGAAATSERWTLHISDGQERIAIVHNWTIGEKKGTEQVRYQLSNHLGSASLELTENAEIISYEEYYPYGGTAFITGKNQTEVKRKTYRYSGKERDDSTGLYYYGARYYTPCLGRWMNPDPAGTVDGLNLYAFVSGNPVKFIDHQGLGRWARIFGCGLKPQGKRSPHARGHIQPIPSLADSLKHRWKMITPRERNRTVYQEPTGAPTGEMRVEMNMPIVGQLELDLGNTHLQNAHDAVSGSISGKIKDPFLSPKERQMKRNIAGQFQSREDELKENVPDYGTWHKVAKGGESVASAAKTASKGDAFNPASIASKPAQIVGHVSAGIGYNKLAEMQQEYGNPQGHPAAGPYHQYTEFKATEHKTKAVEVIVPGVSRFTKKNDQKEAALSGALMLRTPMSDHHPLKPRGKPYNSYKGSRGR